MRTGAKRAAELVSKCCVPQQIICRVGLGYCIKIFSQSIGAFAGTGGKLLFKWSTRWPFNKVGMVNGHVETISPDAAELPDTRGRDRKDTRTRHAAFGVSHPGGPGFALPRARRPTIPGLSRHARIRRGQSRQSYGDGVSVVACTCGTRAACPDNGR